MMAWVVFFIVIAMVGAARRATEGDRYRAVRERRIYIGGIAHTGHVNLNDRTIAYDCTGHGHFVFVQLRDGVLVSNDPAEDDGVGPAARDERRAWEDIFGPIEHATA